MVLSVIPGELYKVSYYFSVDKALGREILEARITGTMAEGTTIARRSRALNPSVSRRIAPVRRPPRVKISNPGIQLKESSEVISRKIAESISPPASEGCSEERSRHSLGNQLFSYFIYLFKCRLNEVPAEINSMGFHIFYSLSHRKIKTIMLCMYQHSY